MTSRFLVAALVLAILSTIGCPSPAANYNVVKVDNKMVPYKPTDPDDLVVDSEDDDEDEDDKPVAKKAGP